MRVSYLLWELINTPLLRCHPDRLTVTSKNNTSFSRMPRACASDQPRVLVGIQGGWLLQVRLVVSGCWGEARGLPAAALAGLRRRHCGQLLGGVESRDDKPPEASAHGRRDETFEGDVFVLCECAF